MSGIVNYQPFVFTVGYHSNPVSKFFLKNHLFSSIFCNVDIDCRNAKRLLTIVGKNTSIMDGVWHI